jgi:hypothetical protein
MKSAPFDKTSKTLDFVKERKKERMFIYPLRAK